jgi:hypothetical protein
MSGPFKPGDCVKTQLEPPEIRDLVVGHRPGAS